MGVEKKSMGPGAASYGALASTLQVFFLLDPDWELVREIWGLRAEGSACSTTSH